MRISADVGSYAADHGLTSSEAIEAGMADKAEQFVELGSSVYLPASAAVNQLAG